MLTTGTQVACFSRTKVQILTQQLRVRLGMVERDLNTLIYNALIYNECKHPVNIAALRLHKAARAVLKWWLDRGESPCRECGGEELFVENSILICDLCCTGVHVNCQVLSLLALLVQKCTH